MKGFFVHSTCTVCGETFDSDYNLMKHVSKSPPPNVKPIWSEGEHNCS
ncbi:hypothetical protein [Nitrososphaera sp.]